MRKFFNSAKQIAKFAVEYTSMSCFIGVLFALLAKMDPAGCTDQQIIESFYAGFLLAFFGGGLLMLLCEGPHEIKCWLANRKTRGIAF